MFFHIAKVIQFRYYLVIDKLAHRSFEKVTDLMTLYYQCKLMHVCILLYSAMKYQVCLKFHLLVIELVYCNILGFCSLVY